MKTINHETTLFLHVDGLVKERCNSIANALDGVVFLARTHRCVRCPLYIGTSPCIVWINPILLISQAANPVNLLIHILHQLSLNEPLTLLTSRGNLDQYIIFIWFRMILPNIPWTSFCKDIILWKLWCWKPTKQSGPIFYLWLNEVLANERRLYMCHIFSHWLRPWSAIHRQQAKISLVTDVGTRESTRKIWVVNIWLSHVFFVKLREL